ncbi:MAG: POTRA domain-containing protein, partial [bacterium]
MKSNLIKLSLSILIIFILLVSFTINILALEESVKSDIENFEEDSVVKEISFKGLENIEENKIREKMEIKIGDRLDKKILKKDLENISDLKYFQNVSSDISRDKGGIKLIIEIVENPQLKEVNFTGEKIYNKGTFLEITELEIGKVINIDHVSAGLENLEDRLEKDGYIPIYHSGQGRHFIDYENIHLSQEGILEIPINVGVLNQIELFGNEKTKDHVILDEINLNKGDYLRIPEIQSEIKDLYMLEYFEEITPDFHFVSPNSNKVNLELIFQERRTGGFEFGFTYSGVEGLLGRIIFREKNLLGYGQTLGLQLQLGGKRDLNLNFRDPGLLGS